MIELNHHNAGAEFHETWHPTAEPECVQLRDHLLGPLLYTIRRDADREREFGQPWTLEAHEAATSAAYDEAGSWTLDCHSVDGARLYARHHRTELLHATGQQQPSDAWAGTKSAEAAAGLPSPGPAGHDVGRVRDAPADLAQDSARMVADRERLYAEHKVLRQAVAEARRFLMSKARRDPAERQLVEQLGDALDQTQAEA